MASSSLLRLGVGVLLGRSSSAFRASVGGRVVRSVAAFHSCGQLGVAVSAIHRSLSSALTLEAWTPATLN